jgi:hypothetical protein
MLIDGDFELAVNVRSYDRIEGSVKTARTPKLMEFLSRNGYQLLSAEGPESPRQANCTGNTSFVAERFHADGRAWDQAEPPVPMPAEAVATLKAIAFDVASFFDLSIADAVELIRAKMVALTGDNQAAA